MALNRGEAAVGEAGGEPVMALYYEEKVIIGVATRCDGTNGGSGEKGWEVIGS